MTAAGYSGTPLAKKLGIKEGHSVALLGAPAGFEDTLEPVPDGVTFRRRAQGTNDVIVSFNTKRSDFEGRLDTVLRAMDVDGGLWVAWPKKASKVPTDITEAETASTPLSFVADPATPPATPTAVQPRFTG